MSYPIQDVAQAVAHPEEIVYQLAQYAAEGHVVSIRDVQPELDGLVSAVFVKHPPPTIQPSVPGQSYSRPRWEMWHTGVVAIALFAMAVLTAITYVVIEVIDYISKHTTQVAVGVIIVASSILLACIGIAKSREAKK